jgi:hypothetical protein
MACIAPPRSLVNTFPAGLVSAVLVLCILLAAAQSSAQDPWRTVPPSDTSPTARSVPSRAISLPPWPAENSEPIEIRSPRQMTAEDRRLAEASESTIAALAETANFDYMNGTWSYRQIVCPALSGHIFLRYTRNQGERDVSAFSASIERGHGLVHIIPILRRSYETFSPAAASSLTIGEFNSIRREEHTNQPPAWLAMGLCYAALASTDPQSLRVSQPAEGLTIISASAVIASVDGDHIDLQFSDQATAQRLSLWFLRFDSKGTLLKAEQDLAPSFGVTIHDARQASVNPVPPLDASTMRANPVPASPTTVSMKPVPDSTVSILRQSRRLYGCWPLKGA